MPAYVSLSKFTEQGMHTIKDTLKRTEAVKEAAKAMGGRVVGVWWLMGEYDTMIIFEAADDESAMRGLVANGMQGNLTSMTMRAFSEEEMARVIGGLP
jgi:uncharacterized protein with GYD domain